MATVVIAGRAKCKKYAHAEFIASYLATKLPDFRVRRILKEEDEWESWLNETCEENDWYHTKCPIIWRELAMTGGKKKLVGSVGEFLEFCDEYYGMVYFPTDEELENMVKDNIEKFEKSKLPTGKGLEDLYPVPHILISGAASPLLTVFLSDLLKPGQKYGPFVYLYDKPEFMEYLCHIQTDTSVMGSDVGLEVCEVVTSLEEGLAKCDVYIILDDFTRENENTSEMIYRQNYAAVTELASIINKKAKPECRIIFAGPRNAPSCFNATILANSLKNVEAHNVVALTAHFALEAEPIVAKLTGTRIQDYASPAVWGFVPDKYFVDFDNMLYQATYFIPNKRALKRIPDSTLPQGEIITEVRRFNYVSRNVRNLRPYVYKYQKEVEEFTGRQSELPKMKALVSLLNIWYSPEYDEEIVALGVISDGSFGIPKGLVFSQPVILEDDVWKPFAQYPKPSMETCRLENLIREASRLMSTYAWGLRIGVDWVDEIKEQTPEGRAKFMMDLIITECVNRGVEREEKLNDITDVLEDILDAVTKRRKSDIEIPEPEEEDKEEEVEVCEDEEDKALEAEKKECLEYPDPQRSLKEARDMNLINLQKTIEEIDLQRKMDHEIDLLHFPHLREKMESPGSSRSGRLSFHSSQSLLRMKDEEKKKEDKKSVTGLLTDLVSHIDFEFGSDDELGKVILDDEEEEGEDESDDYDVTGPTSKSEKRGVTPPDLAFNASKTKQRGSRK